MPDGWGLSAEAVSALIECAARAFPGISIESDVKPVRMRRQPTLPAAVWINPSKKDDRVTRVMRPRTLSPWQPLSQSH